MKIIRFRSSSSQETEAIACDFAKTLSQGDVIAFRGGLGAGKTAFCRGLAAGMGIKACVTSPTFTIVNEYEGDIPLFHFDMYRINGLDDLYSLDFDSYLDRGGVCAVEWSENITEALPENTVFITISSGEAENERQIIIEDRR